MNLRRLKLMNAPKWETKLCPFCAKRIESSHHIVPRSAGGTNGPTITVCGTNNVTGCHGKLHQGMLHLDHVNGKWMYIETEPCSDFYADMLDGWKELKDWDFLMEVC